MGIMWNCVHARIVHARRRCEPSGTLRSPLASLNSLVSSEPTLSKQLYLPNASFRAEYAWNVQDRPFAPSRKRRNRKKTDGVGRCNVRNSNVSFSSHTSDGAAARTSCRCLSVSYFNVPSQRHTVREVRLRLLFNGGG